MVFEDLINPIKAERKPWETFLIGFAYASIAIIASLFFFKPYASVMLVSLTAMVSIPLVYGTIKLEENKDLQIASERLLLKEHSKALMVFIFLFIGFLTAFLAWFTFLPPTMAQETFSSQLATINEINTPVTGNAISIGEALSVIIFNNLKVMLFCLIFALFYGFGAILILAWNASVLGVFLSTLIQKAAGASMALTPLFLLKYSLHGIPEIAAFFLAGLAGGIISIAIVRHDYKSQNFKRVLLDSIDLIVISAIIIVFAGLLEVFVSPLIIA